MKFRVLIIASLVIIVTLSGCCLFPTYGAPNLTGVQLTINDLPSGYKQLSDQELTSLGITKENFASAFKGAFSNASPQNFTVFTNPSNNNGELVFSVLFYPISQGDIADWNNKIRDPNVAAQDIAKGLGSGSEVKVISGNSKIGDSSIEFSTLIAGNTIEIIEARYFNVAMLFMYRYSNNPDLDLHNLAVILNSRVVNAYNLAKK